MTYEKALDTLGEVARALDGIADNLWMEYIKTPYGDGEQIATAEEAVREAVQKLEDIAEKLGDVQETVEEATA